MELGNPTPQLRSKSQFQNTKIGSDEQSVHLLLPQDIIEEILAILPVKSLLRFKCVSKSWRRLIGSDRFIKIHRQISIDDKTCDNWMVLLRYYEGDLKQRYLKQCSRRSYVEGPPTGPLPIEGPTNKSHSIFGDLVDSCNGLLCILRQPGCFTLFNPATKISNQLPKLDVPIYMYGFGWNETTDAYKVFVVMPEKCIVYSTKTNAWNTVNQGFPAISACSGPGAFACGKIHWLEERNPDTRIESFDLKSEVFGAMELPCKPMHAWLCKVNEYLGLWSYNKEEQLYDVWVMKVYGVKESWVKWPLLLFDNIASYYGAHFYFESLVSPF